MKADNPMVGVARLIAGSPPEWLVVGLGHFRDWVGSTDTPNAQHSQIMGILEQMAHAAGVLEKWLPGPYVGFQKVGAKVPDYVKDAMMALPLIKRDLDRVLGPVKRGAKPNQDRRDCAAVVVECWRLVHGHVPSRSEQLYRACAAYWEACGHDEYRDIEGWRRDIVPGGSWRE